MDQKDYLDEAKKYAETVFPPLPFYMEGQETADQARKMIAAAWMDGAKFGLDRANEIIHGHSIKA